jgi:hypothetical protein
METNFFLITKNFVECYVSNFDELMESNFNTMLPL